MSDARSLAWLRARPLQLAQRGVVGADDAGLDVAEPLLDPLEAPPEDPAPPDAPDEPEASDEPALEPLLSLDDFASVDVDVLFASSFLPGFVDE